MLGRKDRLSFGAFVKVFVEDKTCKRLV